MRLGSKFFKKCGEASEWAAAVINDGYTAAYCPLEVNADLKTIQSYEKAAGEHNLIIAEVGAWSNPLSPDKKTADDALEKCKKALALADEIGARCCVNIAGSRGKKWDGPSPLDLTPETFEQIVIMVRGIIDSVKPKRTFYTLETMPWMYPDSAESYLELLNAIDRKQFAVHFDPVNLINCPTRYFNTGAVIKNFVKLLGKHIKSSHAKDIILRENLTTHLDETRPGLGNLDYEVYLRELNALPDKDLCVMLEHLNTEEEYNEAAMHIKSVAAAGGIVL